MHRDLAIVPEGTTEDKLIELWVRLKKSEHTQRAYRHDIEVFRDFVEKPLAAVTLEDALDFRLDELQSSGQRLRDSISRIQAASSVLAPAVDCLVFP
jgi:site-specific recombinase XerD